METPSLAQRRGRRRLSALSHARRWLAMAAQDQTRADEAERWAIPSSLATGCRRCGGGDRFERSDDTRSDRRRGRARGAHHGPLTASEALLMMVFIGRSLRSSWATPCRRELGVAEETDPGKDALLPADPQRPVWSRCEWVACARDAWFTRCRSESLWCPARSCPWSSASTLGVRSPSRCYALGLPPRMKTAVQSMGRGDATRFCASRKKRGNRLVSVQEH